MIVPNHSFCDLIVTSPVLLTLGVIDHNSIFHPEMRNYRFCDCVMRLLSYVTKTFDRHLMYLAYFAFLVFVLWFCISYIVKIKYYIEERCK